MATAKTRFVKTSFQAGLLSRKAYWRSDGGAFSAGCRELENFRVGDFGEIERRGGIIASFHDAYIDEWSGIYSPKIYGFSLLDSTSSNTSERKTYILYVCLYKSENVDRGRIVIVNADEAPFSCSPLAITDNTEGVGYEDLRHANYDGAEYFVGSDTRPFRVLLKDGVVVAEHVDFMVEPMNDTETLSDYTWTVSTDSDDSSLVKVETTFPYLNTSFDSGMSLMLVNYLDGATISVYAKFDGSNDGKKAGYTSDLIPAMGSITLKTEAGYWSGKVSLYERQREYGGDEDEYTDVCLGTIVAGGMLGSASLPCTITRMNSEVYFKIESLTDAAKTLNLSGYNDQGTTISLVISGTQEVYLKYDSAIEDSDSDSKTYSAKFKMVSRLTSGFTTTSYALSAFFSTATNTISSTQGVVVSRRTNYPRTICFFQDRLVFGGNRTHPKTIWMSRTGDEQSFQVGTSDDYAITTVVSGSDEEEIRWLCPRDALLIGTTMREYALRGSSTAAITPTSIKVSKPTGDSAYGSLNTESFNSDEGLYCLRSGGEKLLRYAYSSDTYSYVPVEVNPLNPEIFGDGGAVAFCVANRPDQTFYVVRTDGKLAVCNYLKHGGDGGGSWSVYSFGNANDGYTYLFKDVCVIRNNGGERDDVFFCIQRREGTNVENGIGKIWSSSDGLFCDTVYSGGSGSSKKRTDAPYTSRVKCTPWLITDGDAWGRRVAIQTTELCMNNARAFSVSYDDGTTWTPENRVFKTEDGEQREIVDEVIECTSPSDWRDEASMVIETDDNHAFVLNAIRARLSVGEG